MCNILTITIKNFSTAPLNLKSTCERVGVGVLFRSVKIQAQ